MALINNRLLCRQVVDTKIYVNPAKVSLYGGSRAPVIRYYQRNLKYRFARKALGRLLNPLQPFLIPDGIPMDPQPISDLNHYLVLSDLISGTAPGRSIWAQQLREQIEQRGFAAYKRRRLNSTAEVEQFLNDYLAFPIADMRQHGWREDVGDVGTGIVSASGELLKTGSGNHRFIIAQILGLDRVPLNISGIYGSYFFSLAPAPLTRAKLRNVIEHIQARYS